MGWLDKLKYAQENVVGMNERNLSFVYPNNQRKHYPLADDKVLCKEVLHENNIACADTYMIIRSMGNLEAQLTELDKHHKMAVKPAKGSGGGGILILERTGYLEWKTPGGRKIDFDMLRTHLANILFGVYSFGTGDKAIIEYCIEPHPFFLKIYKNGVPDFRIIMYKNVPVLAMVRIPTDMSGGKGNLHLGAIGVGVDMETGLLTEGYYNDTYVSEHPDSNVRFVDEQIPNWKETLALSIQTSKAFPLEYLGIDIVYDEELGPMVMEINVRPGLQIQNVNKVGLNTVVNKLKEEGKL